MNCPPGRNLHNTRLHAAGDAVQITELQRVQHLRQAVMLDDEQAVRFLHLAGHLGQVAVRPGTHAHLDHRGHVARHGLLDPAADGLDGGRFAQVVGQPGPHLVDGEDRLDVDAVLDRLDDPVVVADVFGRFGFHDGDARAASLIRVPVFTPNALATQLAAMQQELCATHGKVLPRPRR